MAPKKSSSRGAAPTWCMISFSTSTGRSSSLRGPFAAFSLPLFAVPTASAGTDAAALAGTLASHAGSASFRVAMVCASLGEGESERPSPSSESKGEAVLGDAGDSSGEDAMVEGGEVVFRRHAPPPRCEAKRETAQEQCQCGSGGYVEGGQRVWQLGAVVVLCVWPMKTSASRPLPFPERPLQLRSLTA